MHIEVWKESMKEKEASDGSGGQGAAAFDITVGTLSIVFGR